MCQPTMTPNWWSTKYHASTRPIGKMDKYLAELLDLHDQSKKFEIKQVSRE